MTKGTDWTRTTETTTRHERLGDGTVVPVVTEWVTFTRGRFTLEEVNKTLGRPFDWVLLLSSAGSQRKIADGRFGRDEGAALYWAKAVTTAITDS